MRFRPSPVGTLTAIVVCGICVRLGFWQLSRYEQREGAMAERRVLHGAEPVERLALAPEELNYRRATLTGHFRPVGRVVSGGIPYGKNGYASVATLDLTSGGTVLVLRGWIPDTDWHRHLSQDSTEREVSGVLRRIDAGPSVAPVSRGGQPLWPLETEPFLGVLRRGVHIPWSSLRAETTGSVAPLYLMEGIELADLEDRNPRDLPAGGYAITRRTIHHLEYAAQWFAFALIALGIWAGLGWRRGRRLDATGSPSHHPG